MNLEEINREEKIYEKFIRKIKVLPNGCWSGTKLGIYTRFRTTTNCEDSPVQGHRYSYELFKGPIPQGMQIDHLCMEKSCCNPDHLEVVTPKENIIRYHQTRPKKAKPSPKPRGPRAKRATCRNGHLYDEVGFYAYKGIRACSLCRRLRSRESKGRMRRRLLSQPS